MFVNVNNMSVLRGRAFANFKDALARRIADVKNEKSRIYDVKYLMFLTSKDEFLAAAKNGPYAVYIYNTCIRS